MARSLLTAAAFGAILLTAPQLAQAAPAGLIARPAPTHTMNFSVHFPLRNEAQLDQLIQLQGDRHSPLFHHFLSVAQFRSNYGPTPETIARAAASLKARGFAIIGQTSQSLRVRGATASVESAFRTKLGVVRGADGIARVALTASLLVPAELSALGATVTGLESRVHMHVDSRKVPLNRRTTHGGYYFDDLKQAYSYPSDRAFDGTGATVGVLMESDVLDSDTASQFKHEKYSAISGKTPLPLKRVTLYGGGGVGGPGFDEASIDVQTSQGSAPGAQIVLYNIPDLSDESTIAGYTDVVESNEVDVLSSSFGGCELFFTAAYNHGVDFSGVLNAYHALFKQGNAQGITFVASSGDSAGLGCTTPSYFANDPNARFIPGVENPAADPNVTAVGGTNLDTTAPPSPQPKPPVLRSEYVSESEYGDRELPYDPYGLGSNVSGGYWGSGSGTSSFFAKPWYQYLVNTGSNRRSVPDVSMQMGGCPGGISVLPCRGGESFSIYYVGGVQYGFIGTSLSSPEFAGLLAVAIQANKTRLGNVNRYIYELAAANDKLPPGFKTQFYHQGIGGYNGVVNVPKGTRGYNPIVGVGTPYTQNLIGVPQFPLAGDPQTLSNP